MSTLDLRNEGPFLTLEALLLATQTEEVRTGERPAEIVLTLEQQYEVYGLLQQQAPWHWPRLTDAGEIRWANLLLRGEP